MIEPKNGYVAFKRPDVKTKTKSGIQKTDEIIAKEIWQPSRLFEVLAIDNQSGLNIMPGDKVYIDPSQAGQVLVINHNGAEIYMLPVYVIVGVGERVSFKNVSTKTNSGEIDTDFKDAKPIVVGPKGEKTLIMGQKGKS